jgi:NDP-sugar pyrophosphorylase family protein
MPTISSFYGISIVMNYKEHNPPHFHAFYGEYDISVEIKTGVIIGTMPKRALKMIFEWLELHKDELLADWELAQNKKQFVNYPLKSIALATIIRDNLADIEFAKYEGFWLDVGTRERLKIADNYLKALAKES